MRWWFCKQGKGRKCDGLCGPTFECGSEMPAFQRPVSSLNLGWGLGQELGTEWRAGVSGSGDRNPEIL